MTIVYCDFRLKKKINSPYLNLVKSTNIFSKPNNILRSGRLYVLINPLGLVP